MNRTLRRREAAIKRRTSLTTLSKEVAKAPLLTRRANGSIAEGVTIYRFESPEQRAKLEAFKARLDDEVSRMIAEDGLTPHEARMCLLSMTVGFFREADVPQREFLMNGAVVYQHYQVTGFLGADSSSPEAPAAEGAPPPADPPEG